MRGEDFYTIMNVELIDDYLGNSLNIIIKAN
jgi:hypothetical protein